MEIKVDNAVAVSFQKATNPDTRVKGMIDMRDKWVKELQDMGKVKAVKVNTKINVADLLTKCHGEKDFKALKEIVRKRGHELADLLLGGYCDDVA